MRPLRFGQKRPNSIMVSRFSSADGRVLLASTRACTTCPAGLTGTLAAIEGILKAEVDPEIVVITV